MNRKVSLQKQTLWTIAPVATILFAFVGAFSVRSVNHQLRGQVQQQVTVAAEALKKEANNKLSQAIQACQAVAGNDIVINSIVDVEHRNSTLQSFIRSLELPGVRVQNIVMTDYVGNPIAVKDRSLDEPGHKDEEWLRQVMSGESYLHMDSATLTVAHPVEYGGQPEAALIATYRIEDFFESLAVAGADSAASFAFRGRVFAASTPQMIGRAGTHRGVPDEWFSAVANVEMIPDLSVTVYKSNKAAANATFAVKLALIVEFLSITGILIAGIWFATSFATRPLNELIRAIDDVHTNTDLSRRVGAHGSLEFARLGERFNSMLAQLERTTVTREQYRIPALVAKYTDNAVIITDLEGRIEWVNEGFRRLSGYSLKEVKGRKPGSILQGRETCRETIDVMRQALADENGFDVEIMNYSKDRTPYWVSIETRPIHDEEGNVVNYVAIESDITRLVKARERTESLNRDLAKQIEYATNLAKEAEAANRAKSDFLANMSHEIRTPMTSILGYADLLMDEENLSAEERRGMVSTIQQYGRHLLNILNDVLDMSKIEVGKIDVERIDIAPSDIVSEILALMRPQAEAKEIGLHVAYSTMIPKQICSDPTRLRQILVNLVGNAIKFTETGGVTVNVSYDESERLLSFAVVDTGVGMTPSQRDLIARFEAFSQADTSTTRNFGGSGLGLRISNSLAQMLGGGISVESTFGQGSVFTATIHADSPGELQLITVDEESRGNDVSNKPQQAAVVFDFTGRRLLLAEDTKINQRLVARILSRAGALVEVADNGKIALDMALKAYREGQAFDAILMDMQMPVMDGYTAVQLLRQHDYRGPVVALTANAMSSDRQKCIDAGCDDYSKKPIDKRELLEKIARLIQRDDSLSAGYAPPNDPDSLDALSPEMANG